jgi:hypothetical protein
MQPTRPLWRKQADLLAADTTGLASVTANHVHLAKAPFTPSLDLVIGDLTEATFTGSGPLDITAGTQLVYYDAEDGMLTIELSEPSGGWHWDCTVDPVSAETIFGVYITDNTDATLLGSMLLPTAVTISAAGQGLTVGVITLKFAASSPS